MSNTRTIETPASSDLATLTIRINGEELSRTWQLLSVSVGKEIDRIPFAMLTILDGEASRSDFKASNTDLFIPGNELEILSGYHSDEATIFNGIIIRHSLKIRKTGSAQLIIECRDQVFKMSTVRRSKHFYDSTDSSIIEDIALSYGLPVDIASTSPVHAEMVQYDISDWDFLLTRSQANGLMCVVDDGNLSIQSPDLTQEPVLSLEYGATILEFDAEIDARNQFSTVKSMRWDPATQEIVDVEASEPGLTLNGNLDATEMASGLGQEEYNMPYGGTIPEEVIQAWADAKLLRGRLSKTRGRVKFQGVATPKPGMTLELKGVGDRFNENAFISGVFHSISDGQWTTDIQFGIDPEWFSKRFDLSRRFDDLVPGIRGLQTGIVVQLEEDPDGEDRIKVKLPVVDNEAEGIWARLSCLDAGDSRGIFFRPEVDDEVIVGFVNNDPGSPVILGMLHSSAKPAPEPITPENNIKGFVSRNELKLLFDDDKSSVTIETPNGNKLILNDDDGSTTLEDENGNKIAMTSDGITIESAGDINLSASGDVKIEGINITNDAQNKFQGKGNGGAELISSAIAKVEGSLVRIN